MKKNKRKKIQTTHLKDKSETKALRMRKGTVHNAGKHRNGK